LLRIDASAANACAEGPGDAGRDRDDRRYVTVVDGDHDSFICPPPTGVGVCRKTAMRHSRPMVNNGGDREHLVWEHHQGDGDARGGESDGAPAGEVPEGVQGEDDERAVRAKSSACQFSHAAGYGTPRYQCRGTQCRRVAG
jgi:hypothetical protein